MSLNRQAAKPATPLSKAVYSTLEPSIASAITGAHASLATCSHCGLPVPGALFVAEASENFCCAGCATVYGILTSSGLTEYYSFRERLGEKGRHIAAIDLETSEFDSPAFKSLYCQELDNGTLRTELVLEGIHCAACVWLVERVARLEPAVHSARCDMSRSVVEIAWDPRQAPLSQVARALSRMGYRARPSRGQEAQKSRKRELRALLVRIGVAGATAGNVMLMAFALYSGAVGLDEAGTMAPETSRFFARASLLVSLPALWAGSLFFRGAWASLRTRTAHMDLPITIGILVAFVWGATNAISGHGEIYFDTITALIFFLLIGRYITRRQQMVVSDAAELFHAVVPGMATLVDANGERLLVAAADLAPNSQVWVCSGEVIPVDGVIVEGKSALDKSLLSGESRPITVQVGDVVEAGALNLGAPLTIEVKSSGSQTRVAALMSQVETALSTRTPLVHLADRLAGVFTIAVIVIALGVGLFFSRFSVETGVERALALLIVACPCALGLATPLSLSVAVRRAARAKQLIFSPAVLEQLAQKTELILDKTGTLTEGRLEVLAMAGDESLLPIVQIMERDARHPVGRAIVEFAKKRGASPYNFASVHSIQETLGAGLEGRYGQHQIRVGSVAYVTEKARLSEEMSAVLNNEPDSRSPVLVGVDEQVRALFWVGDRLRNDALSSLLRLRAEGHRLHLLSGDHPTTVDAMARNLTAQSGLHQLFDFAQGGVSPEEKLRYVRDLQNSPAQKRRPVVMVGDGINDAGALAQAEVGIAVQGAAEASRLTADVYLSRPGVLEVVRLFTGSRRTLSTIRRGIAFSLLYNGLAMLGAALGLLGPLGAAILMPLSSLTVVTNAFKSRTFDGEESPQ